jgi:hypothetical protein
MKICLRDNHWIAGHTIFRRLLALLLLFSLVGQALPYDRDLPREREFLLPPFSLPN